RMMTGWRVISPVAGGVSRGPGAVALRRLDDALLDQPGERLVHRLDGGVARTISEAALGLGDARARAARDVLPRRPGVFGCFLRLPFVGGQEFEPRLAAEPAGDRLGVAAERDGSGRNGVKGLADRGAPIGDRLH